MSDKKRKKSYSVLRKKELIEEAKQRKTAKKKEYALMSVICVLIFALAFGIVFGGKAIYNSMQKKDYCEYADDLDADYKKTYYATVSIKGYGSVTVLLIHDIAPATVNKFVAQANAGFYNGLTLYSLSAFKAEGGDPEFNGTGGYTDTEGNLVKLAGEYNNAKQLKHIRGVFSMASVDDNNSTSSRFLICSATNKQTSALDGVCTSIGYVTNGMNIIDKIISDMKKYADDNGIITDKSKQIVIESISILDSVKDSESETGPDIFD